MERERNSPAKRFGCSPRGFPRGTIVVYRDRYAICHASACVNRAFYCTYFPAAAAEHGCCAAAAASRRRELRLMTDVAESCAPFPLQLHHAHLQLPLLPLPLSLTDTDSTTVLDAHVFSPLHEFGASCPLPEIAMASWSKYGSLL